MTTETASAAWVRERLTPRRAGAHKWSVGCVIAIAGSPQYTGAGWLVCRSAGRAGAGIVFLASPRSVCQALAPAMPEVAHIPLPESGSRGMVEELRSRLTRATAVVVGPGLGDDDATDSLLSALFGFTGHTARRQPGFGFGARNGAAPATDDAPLFASNASPIVIDADALTWLSRQDSWWERVPAGRLILTPHAGELARLTGESADDIADRLPEIAQEYATRWHQTVVCKGAPTVASDGERVIVADDAPLSLATAGSGDCFAGTIGALVSQGLAPLDAAGCAMYIGTIAARECESTFGVAGVIAADLPDAIARATRDLLHSTMKENDHGTETDPDA